MFKKEERGKRSNSRFEFLFNNNLLNSKRSQSNILVVVLLILLVLVAMIIIWVVVKGSVKKISEDVGITEFTLGAEIDYFRLIDNYTAEVRITRSSGTGNITGVKFIFEDSSGNTYSYTNDTFFPRELESKTYIIKNDSLNPAIPNFLDIIKVSVYYTYKNEVNAEKTTQALDTQSRGSGSSSGGTACSLVWSDTTEFRCNSGIREVKQTNNCNPNTQWVVKSCSSDYVCYDGNNAPDNKCINKTQICIDVELGIDYNVKGFANKSGILFNDVCSGSNLTEYYCYYNSSNKTEVKSEIVKCDYGCSDGKCLAQQCIASADCSFYNLLKIASCTNNPDNNPLTFDYAPANNSLCNAGLCTIPTQSVISSCNKTSCGASCDFSNNCPYKDCDYLDDCYIAEGDGKANDYYDYSDVLIPCLANCSCGSNSCSNPVITYNDSVRCPGVCTNDIGCSSIGNFCDYNTPYTCALNISDGCFDRTNGTRCSLGEYCNSTGQCTTSPYIWKNGPSSNPNFFPIGVWLQAPNNIDEFKNIGINTFIGLWNPVDEPQLSALRGKNMSVIAGQNSVGLTSQNNTIIKGWLEVDEPDCAQWNATKGDYDPCIDPLVIQQMYNSIKLNDSSRPVYINFGVGVGKEDWNGRGTECFGRLDMYPEYIKGADIISFDIYPVTSGFLFSELTDGVERLVNWSNGTKIVWNIIETTHVQNAAVRPTAEQIKSEVWMSIIHGSMGIAYFVHEWQPSFKEDGIFRYPEIVGNVTKINERITSLAPVLNSPTIKSGLSVTSNDSRVIIKTMLKQYNGSIYLFAIAMGNYSSTADFSISSISNGNAEVIDESRSITIANNNFQDNFKPYEVHIYKISESFISECLSSNNCFYVSVLGAGSHNGALGNEMNLNEAMNYANLTLAKNLTFMLEDGNYGAVSFASNNNRTASVFYKSVNKQKAVFGTIIIGKSSGGKIDYKLTLDSISVLIDPLVKPTPTGYWISGYYFGLIQNSADVTIKDSYFKGFDKYVTDSLQVKTSENIWLLNNEAKTFIGGFPEADNSENLYIINNSLSNISVGSIIRILEGCTNEVIKYNTIFNCNVNFSDYYFPSNTLGTSDWHPGSVFSMRSDDFIIDGNIVHDCHIAQTIKTYDGVGGFSNLIIQNNLFYDISKHHLWNLEPTYERPIIIRNNIFIGEINLNRLATQYDISQRYFPTLSFKFFNDQAGFYFDNNIVNSLWVLPDIENLSNKLEQDNNIFYSYDTYGKYERRGVNTIFGVWMTPSGASYTLHGYPNFFENIGYKGTTQEYNYSRDGFTQFFVNPGFYTKDIGWDSGTNYRYVGDAARYFQNGKYYQNLQANNLNHTPATSPTWWQENSSLSFWEKDMRRYDLDYHPLINSVICNGGYLYGTKMITNAVVGVASAGALPCVCTADSQCVEVYGTGSTCSNRICQINQCLPSSNCFYVSSSGTGTLCSLENPCSLDYIISNVKSNSTVYLRAGTYPKLIPNISGNYSAMPIKFIAYNNENVKIDYINLDKVNFVNIINLNAKKLGQWEINWTFDNYYLVGTFANDDFWVVGPVNIISITPVTGKDASGFMTNGSIVNPIPTNILQGLDGQIVGYSDTLNIANFLPFNLEIGKSLISSKSQTTTADPNCRSVLKSASILTCVSTSPALGSFRPAYTGNDKAIRFNKAKLDYSLLAKLAPVASSPSLSDVAKYFEKPWIDFYPGWVGAYLHPCDNMPNYGAEIAVREGVGALALHLNYPDEQKESLMINFVQLGIDNYGIIKSGGISNWGDGGGHGPGRKWPILFAGIVLNDSEMKSIGNKSGDYLYSGSYGPGNLPPDYIYFGEDHQTHYVSEKDINNTNNWIASAATLHPDNRDCTDNGYPTTPCPNWIPYNQSDLGLPEWGIVHANYPFENNKWLATEYRFIVGYAIDSQALPAIIMNARTFWNNNAFFDYTDRYMVFTGPGGDYPGWWRSSSAFAANMWDAYRNNYGCTWQSDVPLRGYSNGHYNCSNYLVRCSWQNSTVGNLVSQCSQYSNQRACNYDPCNLKNCSWSGTACVEQESLPTEKPKISSENIFEKIFSFIKELFGIK